MKKYKHVFFDLDHTLWDFELNSTNTLKKLFTQYKLNQHFTDYDHFFNQYKPHNSKLWGDYRYNRITKRELNIQRFHLPLLDVGVDNIEFAKEFSSAYIQNCSLETQLMPHALEILTTLTHIAGLTPPKC